MTTSFLAARLAGAVALLVLACVTLAAPASCQTSTTPPVQLLDKPLVVGVFNALNGNPVTNATVSLVGQHMNATTDSTGHATFPQIPVARVLRLWTYPSGYTPGTQEIRVGSSPVNWVSIFVMPLDMYSTGLINHTAGGTFTFTGTIVGAMGDMPFWFQIDVPPNSLGEDYSLDISPRPTFAEVTNGMTGWDLTLGQWHVCMRNAAGAPISATLAAPAIFRFKPWTAPGITLEDPAAYPPGRYEYRLYKYDYGIHQFSELPNVVTPNAQDGTVSVPIQSFSFFTAKKRGYGLWAAAGQDNPPPPPPPEPEVSESYQCDTICSATINCGSYGMSCSYSLAAGSSVSVSAGLKAALDAQYSQTVNAVLAKVSVKVGLKLEASVSGEYTSSTSETITGSVNQGAGASGPCYSGPFKFKKVSKVYAIEVLGVTLGTIVKPTGTEVATQLSLDTTCGPQCETAGPPPTAVNSCPF